MKKDASHVVMGDNSARCLHCGAEQAIAMPTSINVFVAVCKAFSADHAGCKPSERGRARLEYKTPHEWMQSWDTGESSKTIWNQMMHGSVLRPAIPHDPGDFGRCYRLLKAFPEWRARIEEMRRVPQWDKLVDNWARLEFLFEQESPGGSCPQLYSLLQRCR